MSHIFISYSHKDSDYVHKLQEALQNEGFEVWIDDRIDYGDEWPMVIQDRLDACDAFILVATDNSYKSKWVQKEVTRAQRINKPFFPLLLSGNPWLSIESTQYVNVRDKTLPPEKFYRHLASVTPRNKPIPLVAKPQEKLIERSKPKVEKSVELKTKRKAGQPFNLRIIIGVFALLIVISLCIWVRAPLLTIINQIINPEPTNTPSTSYLGIGSIKTSAKDNMKLVYIPIGSFYMGGDLGNADEAPVHPVFVDAFWVDETDVTNKMYSLCAGANACKLPTNSSSSTHGSYYGNPTFDNYPVIYVNWYMADAYCKWAGRRLPTEAEWEKVARSMDRRRYPWGNNAPSNSLLNYNHSIGDTTEVGKFPNGASPYGALDMAGNVWQWVADLYSDTYYAHSPTTNPLNNYGQYRVLRGGSWFDDINSVNSIYRHKLNS